GDVTDPADVDRMVRVTVEEFGRLDVLVANAGGPPAKPFESTSDEEWARAFELNLLSTVRLIRSALPHLEAGSSIITISSISVKQPVSGLVLSNSLRPGGIGLIKTLADELGARGIRLNNILPGMIATDRAIDLAESRAKGEGKTAEEIMKATAEAIPLRRYGSPDEIADLAVFLASDAASYITGTSILCDGGLYRGLF
ncbi:MAG TPA: SDR family oxidoreductase, partial [Chloroflexota bacterium]|nr:SDR family oxidoreductase [Chloroflexota bacterium]